MRNLLKEYFNVKGTRRHILLALVLSATTAVAKCIEFVYKDIEESPFFPNKTEEFYGILNRMKAARIENVLSLKNKSCA